VAEVANRESIAIVEVIDTSEHYGIAVDPAPTALLAAINQAFAATARRRHLPGEIYDTWFKPRRQRLCRPPPPAAIGTLENRSTSSSPRWCLPRTFFPVPRS
jgi:hypothetical protein